MSGTPGVEGHQGGWDFTGTVWGKIVRYSRAIALTSRPHAFLGIDLITKMAACYNSRWNRRERPRCRSERILSRSGP